MVKPIGNKIVVKAFMGTNTTLSGLYIPDNLVKEGDKVEVVAVGNGTGKRPMKLKKGDIGYRVHGWGMPIECNGELFYMMEDAAIIALD
jgi:co-chaperonin GroES (HSP10)